MLLSISYILSTISTIYSIVLTDPRILNCPEKADWHDCIDEEDEETDLAKHFRKMFSPFDVNDDDNDIE